MKHKILLLTAILFLTATVTLSQTTTERQDKNSANSSRLTPPVADDLAECAQLLNKTLEANKALRAEIEARVKEQSLSNQEIASLRALSEAQKAIISNQERLIEILLNRSKTKIKVCLVC